MSVSVCTRVRARARVECVGACVYVHERAARLCGSESSEEGTKGVEKKDPSIGLESS